MASHRQASRSFAASILTLLACTAFISTGFLVGTEAAAQKPKIDDPNIPKIDLLLSGGGLRASAFAYGVLAGLNEICVPSNGADSDWYKREADSDGKLPDCDSHHSSLLDRVNIISAVSGGAITAAYFKANREEFFEEFPKLLKKSHLERRLLTTAKPFSFKRIFRTPVFLLTSILDMALIPLSVLNLNIEFTPVAVMWLSDGLLESAQLASVYNDLFYDHTQLESLSEQNGFPFKASVRNGTRLSAANDPMLLINATDITNGTVFTFDKRTFECMGVGSDQGNVELALAVAASSSLPGVFSPVRLDNILEPSNPQTIPTDCPAVLANRSANPVLVDGGVTDNFGAIGLLRVVIKQKENFLAKKSDEGSRKSLTAKETFEDHRTKHLLLIVNSEAESDSKLAGLAGHFDASYDVLIRSKKDLVRVMAFDMFNHFGFGTVELRLSDLVTSEPGIKQLVSGEVNELFQGRVSEKDMPQVVPRALLLTEQEQRVSRNLGAIGMLPSSSEIDTLIAIGRKIVAQRLNDLEEGFKSLSDKTYNSNCSNIVNPDKYFCWPSAFRSHDLDSGGGSAFLQTVSQVTRDFIETSTQERERLIAKIRDTALRKIAIENIVYAEANSIVSTLEDQKGRIGRDEALQKLYDDTGQHLHFSNSSCQSASVQLKEQLGNLITKLKPPYDSARLLNEFRLELYKQRSLDCNPNYYILLGALEEAAHPDSTSTPTLLYHEALIRTDPNLNRINIHGALGPMLIHRDKNFVEGLSHIRMAIGFAERHEQQLKNILGRSDITSEFKEKAEQFANRMHLTKLYNEMLYAQYAPLSPVAIPGSVNEVHDTQTLAWERKHLRFTEEMSLLEELEAHGLTEKLRIALDRSIESLKLFSGGAKHLIAVVDTLNALKLPNSSGSSVSDAVSRPATIEICALSPNGKEQAKPSQVVEKARCLIRAHLAESAGLEEGEELLRNAYYKYLGCASAKATDRSIECNLYLGTASDILATYGFSLSLRSIETPCPGRKRKVDYASSLIDQAIRIVESAGGKKNLDEHEKKLNQAMLDRFNTYRSFGTMVGCAAGP